MIEIFSYLGPYGTPTVVVAIFAAAITTFMGILGYRLNKKKEIFETRNYTRKLLQELFDLDKTVKSELVSLIDKVNSKVSFLVNPSMDNTGDFLNRLNDIYPSLIEKSDKQKDSQEVIFIYRQASNLHYTNIAHRELILYYLSEIMLKSEQLLNNFERYSALHKLVMNSGQDKITKQKWLTSAHTFYHQMKLEKDSASQIRIGITLVGEYTESGNTDEAKVILGEISQKKITVSSGMDPKMLENRLGYLEKQIEKTFGDRR